MAAPERTLVPNDCRAPNIEEEGHAMRARLSSVIGMVLCCTLMGLIGLMGGAPTSAQPSASAVVAITFPGTKLDFVQF